MRRAINRHEPRSSIALLIPNALADVGPRVDSAGYTSWEGVGHLNECEVCEPIADGVCRAGESNYHKRSCLIKGGESFDIGHFSVVPVKD